MKGKEKYHMICDSVPHYMWHLKYGMKKLTFIIVIDSQTWRTGLWLPQGGRGLVKRRTESLGLADAK